MYAAVKDCNVAVVRSLLTSGSGSGSAKVNADKVMWAGAYFSTPEILELLLSAGGDVNDASTRPLLFIADGHNDLEGKMRVLLSRRDLDMTVTFEGKSAEEFAEVKRKSELAALIAHEVRPCVAVHGV